MSSSILIDSVVQLIEKVDAAIVDQWGVLHDGKVAYPTAPKALGLLQEAKIPTLVLTNSGKRAQNNVERLAKTGIASDKYDFLLSSGEALWQDIQAGKTDVLSSRQSPRYYLIMHGIEQTKQWWRGLETNRERVEDPAQADIVLLLNIPDDSKLADCQVQLSALLANNTPLICANPDRRGLAADGLQVSPGAVADLYEQQGGTVHYYGKPHTPIFTHALAMLGNPAPERVVMCGDLLETDIAGGQASGLKTLFVRRGVLASNFTESTDEEAIKATIAKLAKQYAVELPTYSIEFLS